MAPARPTTRPGDGAARTPLRRTTDIASPERWMVSTRTGPENRFRASRRNCRPRRAAAPAHRLRGRARQRQSGGAHLAARAGRCRHIREPLRAQMADSRDRIDGADHRRLRGRPDDTAGARSHAGAGQNRPFGQSRAGRTAGGGRASRRQRRAASKGRHRATHGSAGTPTTRWITHHRRGTSGQERRGSRLGSCCGVRLRQAGLDHPDAGLPAQADGLAPNRRFAEQARR